MGNGKEVPQKIKNGKLKMECMIQQFYFINIYPEKMTSISGRNTCTLVHCSTIHSSQDLGRT